MPSSGPDPRGLLDLAVAAAHAAGRLLEARPDRALTVDTKSTATDVVTEMDTAAERLIVETLLTARPDDGMLGEEGGRRPGRSGVRWVVDPIDGTVNYLYGIPQYAVSIAVELVSPGPAAQHTGAGHTGAGHTGAGEVVAGVVHQPATGATYTAVRGEGAFRDGRRLSVSGQGDLGQALVATGFGYAAGRRARQAEVLRAVLPRVRDIRRFGSAALDLCLVASGQVDGYYERGLQPWDLAAGALVAREAGARVEGLHGGPPGERLVLAAGPALFAALHDLLAPLGPDRD